MAQTAEIWLPTVFSSGVYVIPPPFLSLTLCNQYTVKNDEKFMKSTLQSNLLEKVHDYLPLSLFLFTMSDRNKLVVFVQQKFVGLNWYKSSST